MRAVGVKVLKNRLSEYLRIAAAGETVLVTDRDKIVAEIRPPGGGRGPDITDAQIAELIRRGIVRPARRRFTGPPPRKPVAPTETILAELDRDREDR